MSATPTPRPDGLPPVPLAALAASCRARVTGTSDGPSTTPISGVALRHESVRPGDLFAALRGSTTHGAGFASAAVAAGARAILTDAAGATIIADAAPEPAVPVLVVDDPRAVVGAVAAQVYGYPSRGMDVIGVTGTSGKTTTCYLLEAALASAGDTAGLIGTVGASIAGRPLPSMLTTPEAPDLQALFAVMRQRGVTAVAMEVSSHALVQGRVGGTAFRVGAFTNLSQDHLDFHGDMEHYFAAKRLLFDGRARDEVVVIDDDYGRRLATDRPAATTVTARAGTAADWSVVGTDTTAAGVQHLTLTGPGRPSIDAEIAMPGAFNRANAATAIACAAAAGRDPVRAAAGLATVTVPGRMERVDAGQPFLAIVDYAHKPAALRVVLAAARERCTGRLIAVIGAGGDRDHGKRPMMGRIAVDGADIVIVTDDNPRSEDPAAIRRQLLDGAGDVRDDGRVQEIGDRRQAIRAAIRAARTGDVVVVAGKGHEQGQEIAGVVHPFSDRDEVLAALAERSGVSA